MRWAPILNHWRWVSGIVTTSTVACGSRWRNGGYKGCGGRKGADCRGNARRVAGPSRWMDREVDNRRIAWQLLTDDIYYEYDKQGL